MSSNITLKNLTNTEFKIEHTDGTPAKSISSKDMTVAVDNVAAMQLLTPHDGMVCIVRDLNRGGTFIYDSTKVGSNNQGTNFVGWTRQYSGNLTPLMFGAKGDGITDDSIAINNCISYYRTLLIAYNSAIYIDLVGRTYLVASTINMTKIASNWSWGILNGGFIGKCVGKPIIDFVGSRGGKLENVNFYGDITSTPSSAFHIARSSDTGFGFCDNWMYDNIDVSGYYSQASVIFIAQESTTYNKCQFWNFNPTGYAAIHSGGQGYPVTIVSEFATVSTAQGSYINNMYNNIDYRYLPTGNIVTVTGISKTNPAVVTYTGAASFFEAGANIVLTFSNAAGMTEVQGGHYTVGNPIGNTFELVGIDATSFSVFSGTLSAVRRQTKPTVYMSRMEQHEFNCCYVVGYGNVGVYIDVISTVPMKNCRLDFLFEGATATAALLINNNTYNFIAIGTEFKGYNIHALSGFLSSNHATNELQLYDCDIVHTNSSYGLQTVVGNNFSTWKLKGSRLVTPTLMPLAGLPILDNLIGTHVINDTGESKSYGIKIGDSDTVSCVLTPSVGSFNTYSASCNYKRTGDIVYLVIYIVITDAGTASGNLSITLPFTSSNATMTGFYGRNISDGSMLQGSLPLSSNTLQIWKYNNTAAFTGNQLLLVNGFYFI